MRYLDFLQSTPLPEAVSVSGFADIERDPSGEKAWRWSVGASSTIIIPPHQNGYELRFAIYQPKDRGLRRLSVLVNGIERAAKTLTETTENTSMRLKLAANETTCVEFRHELISQENNSQGADQRALAFCFTELKIIDAKVAGAKICAMPFTRLEINGRQGFVPCCAPWLTQEYHALARDEDPWNGTQAQVLRERILEGDYRYCRTNHCQTKYYGYDEILAQNGTDDEFLFSEGAKEAVEKAATVIAGGPTAATLLSDPRCNLACPSCRTEKITKADAAMEAGIARGDRLVQKYKASFHRLRIAGDGEALFSPYLRGLIQSLNPREFPALKIVELHTNGILLDEKTLHDLEPGSAMVNRVLVSVDAGTEEVYRKVRGGDWPRLVRNLKWVGEERKRGRFGVFSLLFVYRETNFETMESFVELAEQVGADKVHFSPLTPWERMAISDFNAEAVHLPGHGQHALFAKKKSSLPRVGTPTVTIT